MTLCPHPAHIGATSSAVNPSTSKGAAADQKKSTSTGVAASLRRIHLHGSCSFIATHPPPRELQHCTTHPPPKEPQQIETHPPPKELQLLQPFSLQKSSIVQPYVSPAIWLHIYFYLWPKSPKSPRSAIKFPFL